jgi:transcriptional regulator with XRE-family HTH domain
MAEPTFGDLLKEYRRAAGCSQETLAERAGLSAGAARLTPARDETLRASGAEEDLHELLEEYLAQPAADDSARPSATSRPRPTSVMRSSPN